MCREELLLFYDTASKLGVTDLLLPIVIFGENVITEESQDNAVRIVAARQFRVLRDAVFAGVMTPQWNRDLFVLADELVDAVEAAEARLEMLAAGGRIGAINASYRDGRESGCQNRRKGSDGSVEGFQRGDHSNGVH